VDWLVLLNFFLWTGGKLYSFSGLAQILSKIKALWLFLVCGWLVDWSVDGLWIVGGSWCGWLVDCGSVWYVDSVCCGYCSTELKVV